MIFVGYCATQSVLLVERTMLEIPCETANILWRCFALPCPFSLALGLVRGNRPFECVSHSFAPNVMSYNLHTLTHAHRKQEAMENT